MVWQRAYYSWLVLLHDVLEPLPLDSSMSLQNIASSFQSYQKKPLVHEFIISLLLYLVCISTENAKSKLMLSLGSYSINCRLCNLFCAGLVVGF